MNQKRISTPTAVSEPLFKLTNPPIASACALLLLSTVLLPTAARASTVFASADANVRSDQPTTNFGTSTQLNVSNYSFLGYEEQRSYLSFDVTGAIPPGYAFQSATLVLDWLAGSGAPLVSVYEVTGSWTETGITWNNQPAFAASPLDSTPFNGTVSGMEWDVSGAWPGSGTMDFVLKMGNSWDPVVFASRTGEFPPRLELSFTAVPEPSSLCITAGFLASALFLRPVKRRTRF